MAKIGIITDTTCCIPSELIKQYGIGVVPVGLMVDGKTYKDRFEISPDEFWNKFMAAKEMPGTSAPSPGEFEAVFTEVSKNCNQMICILVSKILSATQSAAEVARTNLRKARTDLTIEIVDSKCAAGALGFLVLEAAKAIEAGKSFEETLQMVKQMLPRVTYLTALDTMKYLIKGGRAPKTAMIGELLQVKPIITNNKKTGEVSNVSRVMGKKKAIQALVDLVANYISADKPLHMMVHYTTNMADGEELKKLVTARYKCDELYFTPYSPVMAAHTGPVLSLAFYAE